MQVGQEKIFEIKNYYNYLYELAVEEQTMQLEKQHRAISTLMKPDRDDFSQVEGAYDKFHEERASMLKSRTLPKQEEHIMDPSHFPY